MLNVFLLFTGMCQLMSTTFSQEMTYNNNTLKKIPRSNRYYKPYIYRRFVPSYNNPMVALYQPFKEPKQVYQKWMGNDFMNKIHPYLRQGGRLFTGRQPMSNLKLGGQRLPIADCPWSNYNSSHSVYESKISHPDVLPAKYLRSTESKAGMSKKRINSGSYIQIPENETMIISPTILIGTKKQDKYKKDQTEWILSNKPLNLYISSENVSFRPIMNDTRKKKPKDHFLDNYSMNNATISKVIIYPEKNKVVDPFKKSEEGDADEPVTPKYAFKCKLAPDGLRNHTDPESSIKNSSESRPSPIVFHQLDKKWLNGMDRIKNIPWRLKRVRKPYLWKNCKRQHPRGLVLIKVRKKKMPNSNTAEKLQIESTTEVRTSRAPKKHRIKVKKHSSPEGKHVKRSLSKKSEKSSQLNEDIDDCFYYYLEEYPDNNNMSADYFDYSDVDEIFPNEPQLNKHTNKGLKKGSKLYEIITEEPPIDSEIETERDLYETNPEDDIIFHNKYATTPFSPLLIPPEKAECERKFNAKCICSMKGFLEDVNNKLKRTSDQMSLLKSIITYSCTSYIPITDGYNITSDVKPRFILKKPKELLQGPETGPKEITPDIFEQFLMRGIPSDNDEFFVFPSTTVEVPCFTTNDMKLSPNLADSTKYRWTHSNEKAITEGRISEDIDHSGTLRIQDVTLDDSDNYTCTVSYIDPDSEEYVKKQFIHVISVVVLPRLVLHTNLHYTANTKCNQEVLEMFEIYLPQYLNNIVCSAQAGAPVCSIEIHNPLCHSLIDQDSIRRSIDPRLLWRANFKKSRWIRDILKSDNPSMETSMNFELDLKPIASYIREASNRSLCNPHCQQKLLLKMIEILRDSFLEALMIPVQSQAGVVFQPSLDSLDIKLLIACDGGLELRNGFCMPCPINYYSEEGNSECLPCPGGFYQDKIASKSCNKCPHPFAAPGCFYLGSVDNILILSALLLLLSALIGMGINCFFKLAAGWRRKKEPKESDSCNDTIPTLLSEETSVKLKRKPEPLPKDFE